jgi:hypothetical protein
MRLPEQLFRLALLIRMWFRGFVLIGSSLLMPTFE